MGFGTWLEATGLVWEAGGSLRVRPHAAMELQRSFCGTCGSVLPAERCDGGSVLLPAGGLDPIGDVRPGWHACAGQRAPWLPACASLPSHPEYSDERTAASAPGDDDSPPSRAPGSRVHGSCLCGAVTYAVSGPLFAMRACHCSRCRRRSGSSYFVGLACASTGMHFLRGEERARSWRLPDSARYVVRFCAGCGSSVPSIIGTSAFIAAGSLDSDPGVRIRCHIYFASRAGWTDRQDDLPHFDALPPPDFDWSAGAAARATTAGH